MFLLQRLADQGLGARRVPLARRRVGFGLLLHRLHTRTDNLAAAGVTAFGMMFRAIAVMVVVFAAAVSDPWVGLAAALVYALAYTAELGLSLVAYYSGPAAGRTAE